MKLIYTFILGALMITNAQAQELEKATFAGGCFWCMEPPFDATEGVVDTKVGYTGGHTKNPTYEEVSAGNSGHVEVIQVTYDPKKVSYEKLISIYWRNIDPTVENRQFCDVGKQYRSVVYFHNDEQKEVAKRTKAEAAKHLDKAVYTEVSPAQEFYLAEEYHQDYYKKNPIRYKVYRYSCKRDQRLESIWKDWEPTQK